MIKVNNSSEQPSYPASGSLNLSPVEQKVIQWLRIKKQCTIDEMISEFAIDNIEADYILAELKQRNLVKMIELEGDQVYLLQVSNLKKEKFIESKLKALEKKIGKMTFRTLIVLTFVTAFLLIPFVFSPVYLPILRESDFDLHQFLHGNSYKLATGYIALFFTFLEMILTARKRGRGWLVKIKIPGSLILWRSLHIFVGVAFLAITVVHTIGSHGINFNAVFLWIFFGVTLSAVVGSVAEMGALESPNKSFGKGVANNNIWTKFLPGMSKGQLIRSIRDVWLTTHIFLVNVFFVMLAFHIFIAYYYE